MELLEQMIAAHGGRALWQSLSAVSARLSFGGLAFAARFNRAGLRERWVLVSVNEPHAVLADYPDPGRRGIFTPGRVWIESAGGEVLAERRSPRTAFSSPRRYLWWDDLDLLYFAGYALWNYLSFPFLLTLPDVEIREIAPWPEAGEIWRRLAVQFPDELPTHSREQIFYFDQHFRLRRFDYDPVLFLPRATAAHYCSEYRNFAGLSMPTRRKVLPRRPDGRVLSRPTLVWIEIEEVLLK